MISYNTNIFELQQITCSFGHGKNQITALSIDSLDIQNGEVVAVVGESGSGKSLLGKTLLRLQNPSTGKIIFDNKPTTTISKLDYWKKVQGILQDPFSAFNPFFSIRSQLLSTRVLLPTTLETTELNQRLDDALIAVNIEPTEIEGKYPFELSGGQMQRMLLARAFFIRPQVLIADEPTSMVDACSRASILDYLLKMRTALGMTIVLTTHDIGLAAYVSDRILVMHRGQIIESGHPKDLIHHPKHEHTQKLLADVPSTKRDWL